MIEVKNLVKKYGTHLAVDHLDFQLEPGRIYGFLGPNGAGKSTKKHIGYLPELPPLYMDMTVLEYLEFAAELKEIPKKEREASVQKVMDITKLNDVQFRLIKNLSKGYRQRVGLAQAILGFPDIIILDEPTVGLDPKQIIEIRELIRELAKEHTVILSSHILAEVREVCDYIMIISRGKLVASDTPENLEHLMAGQNSLEIETKAEPERVRKILRSISGIDKIELERTEEATTYARIETGTAASGEDQDIREAIFLAFAEAGCPLLMLKASKASLEEVFMELTQGEEATADAGDL